MREIKQNVWLDYAIKQMRDCENVVNDDLRFSNEYDRLREEGFILVRLKVSRQTQIKRLKNIYPDSWQEQIKKLDDESETALDSYPFDYYIDSENGLDNLKSEILKIIN